MLDVEGEVAELPSGSYPAARHDLGVGGESPTSHLGDHVDGRRGDEAIRALEEAGLKATVDTGTRSGIVYGQIPLPGRVLARGERVELDLIG